MIWWGGAYNNAFLPLQKYQNSVLRIKQNWEYPTEKLFELL